MKSDFDFGRVGTMDIETSGLDPNFGYVICAGVKEVLPKSFNGKTQTVVISDYGLNEKKMLVDFRDIIEQFDLLITFYGTLFDWRFLNTKFAKYGIRPPVRKQRRDLWYNFKANFIQKRYSLANGGRLFFGKSGKSFLEPAIWLAAIRNEPKAIAYILKHNILDLLETEKFYKAIMPYLGELKRK